MLPSQSSERTLFLQAIEITSAQERAVFLDQKCDGDSALRQAVERLLGAHDRSQGILDVPDQVILANIPAADEAIGSTIGPYELQEVIGEGGFGVVYLAEQTKPVHRQVAVKIIKPGMDSGQVVARFEAERQALALMNHPHIAKVLDGGTTEAGRPYFVMELVKGVPITAYCNSCQLGMEDRLALFMQVCNAVQHAHQKGIIHRDLKPSNILIAMQDGEPAPKIIDFGVAKAIGQKLSDRTVRTQFSQLIGTPMYMSPEQAELSPMDIDTRSDIYSLGVVLYEMLTGSPPYDRQRMNEASFDDLRRIIREEEPPRPSTRISTLRQEQAETLVTQQQLDPRHMSHQLRGELDWVVMKALAKDRTRRYSSASDLAADIERYLHDEPVLARPPSTLYRVSKFTRRNRALVTSVAAVVTALLIGLALATAGFLTAQQRLAEVTQEQENNRVLIELLSDMYPRPWGMKTLGRNHTVLDAIDQISPELETRLANHPVVEVQVRQIFAEAYMAAGEFKKMRDHLHRALEVAREEYGEQHETVAELYAVLADEVGWNYEEPLDYDQKLQYAENAIRIFNDLNIESEKLVSAYFAKGHILSMTAPERKADAEEAQRNCVATADRIEGETIIGRWDLGLLLMELGNDRLDDAEFEMRQAIKIAQRTDDSAMAMATSLSGLGHVLRRKNDLPGAIQAFQQSWQIFRSVDELKTEPRGIRVGLLLAETYFAQGDLQSAFQLVKGIEEIIASEEVAVDSRIDFLLFKGWLLHQIEDYESAAVVFRDSMPVAESRFGNMNLTFVWSCIYCAMPLEALGEREEASRLFEKTHPLVDKYVNVPHAFVIHYYHPRSILGLKDAPREQLARALEEARSGHNFVQSWDWNWKEPAFYHILAALHDRLGDTDQAIDLLEQGLAKSHQPIATYRSKCMSLPTNPSMLEVLLRDLHLKQHDAAKARAVLEQAVTDREQHLPADHIQTAMAQLRLGEFFVDQQLYPEAEVELKGAFDMMTPHPQAVDALRKRAARGLVQVYKQLNEQDDLTEWQTTLSELEPLQE